MTPEVAVVDYGMGNLKSVANALEEIGAAGRLVETATALERYGCAVLPGVGAFRDAIGHIRSSDLESGLIDFAASGRPLLGVCLGMQLLCRDSEENGLHRGLGLVPARVVALPATGGLKVPHMGWNALMIQRNDPLIAGVADGSDVYFLHSFAVVNDDPRDVIAYTEYGLRFTSVFGRGNVYGAQFHPEKSQAVGLEMLRQFVRLAVRAAA